VADNELDVRELRKPDKHPTIFATFGALAVGDSLPRILANTNDVARTDPDASGAMWRLEAREQPASKIPVRQAV